MNMKNEVNEIVDYVMNIIADEEYKKYIISCKKDISDKLNTVFEDVELGSMNGDDWMKILENPELSMLEEQLMKVLLNMKKFTFITREEYLGVCEALAKILEKKNSEKTPAKSKKSKNGGDPEKKLEDEKNKIKDTIVNYVKEICKRGGGNAQYWENILERVRKLGVDKATEIVESRIK